jgi:hypothetical protein
MAKMGGPAAFGDAAEAGTRYCDEANTDTTFQQRTLAARRHRRRRQLENIKKLGSTRIWAELIEELERYGVRDLDARLARYARLDPDILRALGADRFPHPPLWPGSGARR